MRNQKFSNNKGAATLFGTILFVLLILTLASTLYVGLDRFNYSAQEIVQLEEERLQERIVLCNLESEDVNGTEYVNAIFINNTGSLTVHVKAVYIDNEFLCDPSNISINLHDTYIDAKDSLWVNLPPGILYEPKSKVTVSTERGVKSVEYMWKLKQGGVYPTPIEQTKFYFGPLMLDFNKFYYTEVQDDGSFDPSSWKPGWLIEKGSGSVAWNITVTNVDDRNLTLNQFSCFTLFPNVSPSNRRAWYIEPPEESYTQFIAANDTVNIIYIWERPKMKSSSPQEIYTTVCRNKVFLTFFGIFHEHDGTTKPYGQTIPFEAVLVVPPPLSIMADPPVILYPGLTSTINATLTDKGIPLVNENVSFTTTLGTLSASWALTDQDGIATTTLIYTDTPGTAMITATWQQFIESTTVLMDEVPVANFTESAHSVITYEEISFDASLSVDPDGSIVTYNWDFGDGNFGSGIIINHSYVNDGIYIVNLTVIDDQGAIDSTSATKIVSNRPPTAAFTVNSTAIGIGETVLFNASESIDLDGNIVSYDWNFGDNTNGTGETFEHSYGNAGTYTVTLTVTDDDGATDLEIKINLITVGSG